MPIENARLDFRRKPKLSEEIKSLSEEEIKSRAKADEDSPPLSEEELANLAPATPRPIRDTLGLTQEEFARLFQIPTATVRDWEQGRVRPDAAGRALLKLIAAAPNWALSVFADGARISEEQDKILEFGRMIERQLDDAVAVRQRTERLSESIEALIEQTSILCSFGGSIYGEDALAGIKSRSKLPFRKRSRRTRHPVRVVATQGAKKA